MTLPTCTFCEEYEGAYMGTNLADGDTQIACINCLPGFVLGFAAAMTEGLTMEQAEAYGHALDTIMANDPRIHLPRATRQAVKSGGRQKATPVEEALDAGNPIADAIAPAPSGSRNGSARSLNTTNTSTQADGQTAADQSAS